jgi:hypothetical protein
MAGVMLGQRAQALGAQVQQRLGARVEAIELPALFQRLNIAPGAQVRRHVPGDCTQLAGQVLAFFSQACGPDKRGDGLGRGAHGVVGEAAQGQLQLQGQLRARRFDLTDQRQCLVHIAGVLAQQ